MNIKYFWINIDKSTQRSFFMEEQFKMNNIPNQRVSAITPETLSEYIEDKPPYYCGNSICDYNDHKECPLEYSCTTSHLNAIKEGYKSGDDYFVVCEDDIFFPFKIDYDKIIETLPDDFDIFQMMVLDQEGNQYIYNDCLKKNGDIFIKFDHEKRLFSTGMYLISRKGAEKILDIFTNKSSLKFDFTNINSIKQADFILYMYVNTYTSTFPLCFPTLFFISEIHPYHYYFHKNAIETIINNINDNINNNNNNSCNHPFVIGSYDANSFFNHYKELVNK